MEQENCIVVHQSVEIKPEQRPMVSIPKFAPRNAEYFATADIQCPKPIIEDILYPGLALFGAPNKFGKSYSALKLCCDVASGNPFMGKEVLRPGIVLYIDLEGTESRTKKRLAQIGYSEIPKKLYIQYKKGVRTIDDGFIEQLRSWITDMPETVLIVIDMWKGVKGTTKIKEDDYTSINRMLMPIQTLAIENNISIMTTLHTRKQNSSIATEDPFNEIIGSTAYFGSADCGWMLLGKRDAARKHFYVLCRDNDFGQLEYEVEFRNYRYEIIGTKEEITKREERETFENNPIVVTIRRLLDNEKCWEGTMTDLKEQIETHTNCPASPKSLGTEIRKLTSLLYRYGEIRVLFPNKNGGSNGRVYKFYKTI